MEGAPSGDAGGSRIDPGSLAELRRRRLELAERVAVLTWDLGGLTYEMAIRDHYRLDVLAQRAAELQRADGELGELERLLGSAEAGVHGQCRSCGAVHSRGAAYCWRCGAALLAEARPSVLSPGEQAPGGPPVAEPSRNGSAHEAKTQSSSPGAEADTEVRRQQAT